MPLVDLVFTFSKMAVVLIEHNLIREQPNLDFLVSLKRTQSTNRQSVALSAINAHHKLNKMNVCILSPQKIKTKAITRSIGQTFQTCISKVQAEQPHEFEHRTVYFVNIFKSVLPTFSWSSAGFSDESSLGCTEREAIMSSNPNTRATIYKLQSESHASELLQQNSKLRANFDSYPFTSLFLLGFRVFRNEHSLKVH